MRCRILKEDGGVLLKEDGCALLLERILEYIKQIIARLDVKRFGVARLALVRWVKGC